MRPGSSSASRPVVCAAVRELAQTLGTKTADDFQDKVAFCYRSNSGPTLRFGVFGPGVGSLQRPFSCGSVLVCHSRLFGGAS
jgi:hypothetical protein